MRRVVALLVVGVLIFAGVPAPVGSVHEADGNIDADDRHGDLFVPNIVDATLFLHCAHASQAEGQDQFCKDGGNKTLQAAGLEAEPDQNGITDDVSGDPGEETSLTYSFRRARDNTEGVFKSGDIEQVTATLFIENLVSTGDFHVEFFINDDKVGESDTESILVGQTSEESFDIPIDNGTQAIEPGDKLKLRIVGDGSWNLHLHSLDDPSRVTITGQLLRTRSWLEPPDGGTRSSFDLTGSDAERSFQPLMSVRTALGISTIWPVDTAAHKHGGGIQKGENPPVPEAELAYNPVDPGIGSSNPISNDDDCQEPDTPDDASPGPPTELHWDHINSSARFPTLHLHRESGADIERCVIDRDPALAGNWSFDFELKPGEDNYPGDIPVIRCSGGPCVQEVPVEMIEGPAFGLSLDRDDGFKEVLAGETVHYNLRLQNRLASEQTYDLAVDGPGPSGWTAALSDDQVTVSGGGSVSLDLTVTVPESASINSDATTTVTASAPGFDDTKSVAVTTFVGDAPTFDASAFDAEASAGLGDRATFLTSVTNDGNTRETLALSVQGVPGDLSVSLPRSTVSLDAGERDQVRVHVDVPDDVSEELLDATQPMQLAVRSTSDDRTVANGTLRLNILASYGFKANVFHPTHQVRTVNGTPDPDSDEEEPEDPRPCRDTVGNTTYGSYYRVFLRNTGGLADEIDITNITPVQADGENPDNWHAAAYPAPVTTPSEDKQIDGPVTLPAGHSKVQFFVLIYREDRDDDNDGTQDQCQGGGGDPWGEGDVVSVGADLISRNQPGLRRTVNLRLEALPPSDPPEFDVKLERHLYSDTDGDGISEVLDIPQPRPMPPGETQQLEVRLTNTGTFGCVNRARFDEPHPPYRAFLTGVPWAPSFNATRLENFSFLMTEETGVDPPDDTLPTLGADGGTLNVTYDNRLLQMDLTVDEQAEAGQTFKARLHVEAICDVPHLPDPETEVVSDSIPIEFVITEETGMNVTTAPADGEVEVLPGREALVNVLVNNTGSTRPTHNVSIVSSSLPSGWEARIAGTDSLQVPPLSQGVVPVAIEVPDDAAAGEAGSVDVKVTASSGDLQTVVPVGATVVDPGNLALTTDNLVKAVEPGGTVRYNATLTSEETFVPSEEVQPRVLDDIAEFRALQGEASTINNLPTARKRTSAVRNESDGVAYVFGGEDDEGTVLDEIVAFSPENNTAWTTNAHLPTPRQETSAVWNQSQGIAYIFGGEAANGTVLDEVVAFAPWNNTAWNVSTLPTSRKESSAVWNGEDGVAYVFGGEDEDGTVQDEVVAFAPWNSTAWNVSTLPISRKGASAAWDEPGVLEDDGVAYVFGGAAGDGRVLDEIVAFSPSNNTAWNVSQLPAGRKETSAVWNESEEVAYVFGGATDDGTILDEVVAFSPENNTAWINASLPAGRKETSAVWDGPNGSAYIFGGFSKSALATFELGHALAGAPSNWQAHLLQDGTPAPDSLTIQAGESLDLQVELTAPSDSLSSSVVGTTLVISTPDEAVAASFRTHIASQFGVNLNAVPSSLAVRPRDTAQFDLRVHNRGNGVDTIDLTAEDPPPGWSVTIPKDRRRLVLGAQETTSVPVTVDPPDDAPPGLTVPIQVTAASATRPTATDRITLSTTVASYDPEIRADPSPRRIGPGQATNFPITLVNNGTGTDSIELSATALPQRWRVEFSRNPVDLQGGEATDLTVTVVPSRSATARSDNVVIVQARSSLAPGKTDAVTFEVAIADYLSRDVDGDGIEEAAIDTDENVANGYERFRDTDRRNGIVSGEIASFDGDGDGKPDFYVDITGDGDPDIFWSPVADIVTQTTTIDIEGNGIDDFLADADGDEIIDAVYRPDDDDVGPATSIDVDGDLEPEYLADSTGDDRLDRYIDTGDPRPGYMVRTATAFVSEGSYAVDTDGDGSHDTIVDTQSRTARTFTLADAANRLVSSYWYTIVLFAVVIVLFGAVRLASPRERYVYRDYED